LLLGSTSSAAGFLNLFVVFQFNREAVDLSFVV
jgi:hypothetical protein